MLKMLIFLLIFPCLLNAKGMNKTLKQEEEGLILKQYLKNCQCKYLNTLITKDKKVKRSILVGRVLCKCPANDFEISVSCQAQEGVAPEVTQCINDEDVKVSSQEEDKIQVTPSKKVNKKNKKKQPGVQTR